MSIVFTGLLMYLIITLLLSRLRKKYNTQKEFVYKIRNAEHSFLKSQTECLDKKMKRELIRNSILFLCLTNEQKRYIPDELKNLAGEISTNIHYLSLSQTINFDTNQKNKITQLFDQLRTKIDFYEFDWIDDNFE